MQDLTPAGARLGGTAALWRAVAAASATALAAAVALAALRTLALYPVPPAVFFTGAGVAALLVLQPRWLLPALLALAWTSIGRGFFGGIPSPVDAGALAFLGLAAWRARERPELAREVLLVASLVLLPLVASSLAAGAAVPDGPLKAIAFLVIVALCVRSYADAERVAVALAAAGAFLGAGAVLSVLVAPSDLFPLNPTEDGGVEPRAAGPFGEANFFALSLATLVPFALHLVALGGRRRALGLLSVTCLLAGVLATGSRGGLIASGFAVVALGLLGGDWRVRAGSLAAVLTAVALLPLFSAQTEASSQRAVGGRVSENLIALAMLADHPVTGVGPGQYLERYRDYRRRIGSDPRPVREPHSLPLEIAAEQGAGGIAGWLAAGAVLVAFARRRRAFASPLGRALAVALGAYLVGSLFLHGSQLRLLGILAGLAFALAASGRARPAEAPA